MGMGFSGFMLLFNLYLKEYGFLEGRIGNIISAATIGVVIMAIPASIIIRRFPVKRILVLATPIAAFSYIVQVTASQYYIIMAGGLLAGFASVFFRVAAAPFFMRNSTPKERPYLFSVQFAFMLVAGIIGNILGGFLPGVIETYGFVPLLAYRYTLYIFGGMVLVGIIPYLMIHEKPASRVEEKLKLSANRLIILKLFLPVLIVGSRRIRSRASIGTSGALRRLFLERETLPQMDVAGRASHQHLERAGLRYLHLLQLEGLGRLPFALGADDPGDHRRGELAGLDVELGDLAGVDGHGRQPIGH